MKDKIVIYTALGLDGYTLCQPKNQSDYDKITELINGEARKKTWKPMHVKIINEDEGKLLKASDSPWFGVDAFLIFTEQAVNKLCSFLEKYGELLELKSETGKLFIYNPRLCIDAIDLGNSEFTKFGSGKIIAIDKHAFNKKKVNNLAAFKINNLRVSPEIT